MTQQTVDHLFRSQSGKMTAVLSRIYGFQNLELIEDMVQDTFLTALKVWGMNGEPENPEAWLMLVAKNKLLNQLKRGSKRQPLSEHGVSLGTEEVEELFLDHQIQDSQLRVLLSCCTPELPPKSRIMLTLKMLSGFSDTEIAKALLMKPDAVKKAVFRAKKHIQANPDAIRIPLKQQVTERMPNAIQVLYLMFNEGYKRSIGEQVISEDLCYESVRLMLLMKPFSGELQSDVNAILSVMYFGMARFPARLDEEGGMIELEFQDRCKWDQDLLKAGFYFLRAAGSARVRSAYYLEAVIASVHCAAASYEETDWATIELCYQKLAELNASPMVKLNKAIATGMHLGAKQGLSALEDLIDELPKDRLFLIHAAKARLLMNEEQYGKAKAWYQVAYDLADFEPDRVFILKKMEECDRMGVMRRN